MLIRPAPAIHTWFMRFAIDAVFLDRELSVLSVGASCARGGWPASGARAAVLELPAGEAERRGIEPGDRLEVSLDGL